MYKGGAEVGAGSTRDKYVLARNISAIQVIPDLNGRIRLGAIVQLPEGAELNSCGEGFNERTTKVCWHGQFYYIFPEDIEQAAEVYAAAIA